MKMFSNLVLGAAWTYFICRLWQYCELTFNAAKVTDAEVRKIQALARKTEAEAQEIEVKNKREGSQ